MSGPNADEPAKISSIKSCFKPYELPSRDEPKEEQKRENRTPGSNISSVTSHSCSSTSPVTVRTSRSSPPQQSPRGYEKDSPSPSDNISSSKCGSSDSTPLPSSANGSFSVVNNSRTSECSAADLMKDGLCSSTYPLPSVYKPPMMMPSNLVNANCVGCTGHSPLSSEIATSSSFPASLMGSQNGYSPLKMGAFSPASMSSYYARVKTPTGSTIVPFCRDPLCTNCPSYGGMQGTAGSTCPSGCTQCKHDPTGLSASVLNPLLTGLTPPGLYPSPLLSPHGLPYICSWIAGGETYCGKRFGTSDELLQHLRTHTTNLSGAITETALPLGLSLPTSMPGLGGCHLHYSTAPSLTSPAGLRRTYPTALDSLTASRYHPYKPASFGVGPPLPPLPHPGLSPYYNPYMYAGQRFGAAVHQ